MHWNHEAMQVIKEISEKNYSKYRAALQLGLSTRTIERKVAQFQKQGEACFIHGNTGREPVNRIPMEEIDTLITDSPLSGANFTELSRLLKEYHHISVSDSTLRRYYYTQGILSPKCNRKTRRALRKRLRELKKHSELSRAAAETLGALEHETITGAWNHPTKPRSALFGQRIEMDASSFLWIKGLGRLTLHVAIDDATGHLVGLWLEEQETLHGYYKILEQILTDYGIPFGIRTDRRTVFTYNRTGESNPEKDTVTQFAFACSQLGIDLQCNSDPDFKPKVERANQTLQGMLPYRFAMEGITTVAQANRYLKETYMPLFNELFGYSYDMVKGNRKYVRSACIPCTEEQIRTHLVVLSERVVNKGTTIRVDKQYMELHNAAGKRVAITPGTRVTLSRVLDGTVYAVPPNGTWYTLHQVPTRYEHAPDEIVEPKKRPKPPHKPKPGHLWSFERQMRFRKKDALMKKLAPLYTSRGEHRIA